MMTADAIVISISISSAVAVHVTIAITIFSAVSVAVVGTIPITLLLDGQIDIILELFLGCFWEYQSLFFDVGDKGVGADGFIAKKKMGQFHYELIIVLF